MSLGDRIRTARKAADLSQEELARRASISLNAVGLLEKGARTDPHYSTLLKIANALGVDSHWLYTGETEVREFNPKDYSVSPVDEFDIEELENEIIVKARPENLSDLRGMMDKVLATRYAESELRELRDIHLQRVDQLAPRKSNHFEEYTKAVTTANLAGRVLERVAAKECI